MTSLPFIKCTAIWCHNIVFRVI